MPSSMPRVSMSSKSKSKSSYILSFDYSDINIVIPYFKGVGELVAGLFLLYYNKCMYLSKDERKDIMIAYGHEDAVGKDHYEIGPDTWIYLFEDNEGKYLLVTECFLITIRLAMGRLTR